MELQTIDYKSKKCLVLDNGCYTSIAQRLARDFELVYYWTPWSHAYPTCYEKSIGKGLEDEGVYRVNFYEEVLHDVELIVVPEGNFGPIVDDLRSRGFRVWGGGTGEELEYDREAAKDFMEYLKMDVNKYDVIYGLDELKKYLMDEKNENKFIKSDIRGDFESFHHAKWKLTEPLITSISQSLGATKHDYKFIVEESIEDAVEFGYDGFCIDGEYPEKTLFGLEVKDLGYVGRVKPMKDISPFITDALKKVAPYLKGKKYRATISTETRITKDGKSYLIDWTQRFPSPPGEIYQELCGNFTDILWHGADGNLVEPEYTAKFAVEGIIQSSWAAGDGEQAIYVPDEIKQWVKIKNLYKANDTYYFLPVGGGYTEIGGVVALGDSLEECVEKLKEYSDQVEGYKINIPVGSIDKAMEELKKGEKLGIKF